MPKLGELIEDSGLHDANGVPVELPKDFLERIGVDNPDAATTALAIWYGMAAAPYVLAGLQIGYYIAQHQMTVANELEREIWADDI